jgi:hypothetical protein
MIKIKIKLHGQLYWYADRRKEFSLETQAKSIEKILEEITVPLGVISIVLVNDKKVQLNHIPNDGDSIEVYPKLVSG